MPLALNTNHALYPNLKLLIGVNESNALVDLVTPGRTFTPQSGSSFGSGSYGRHFRFGGAQYAPAGAIFDAFTADNTGTLVCVWNGLPYVQTDTRDMQFIIGRGDAAPTARWFPQIKRGDAGRVGAICYDSGIGNYTRAEASTTTFATGGPANMVTITRDGETSHKIYVGATEEASGGKLGSNNASSIFNRFGGYPGQSTVDAELVWAVWFDAVLTPTQVAGLYNSLGANNKLSLVYNDVVPTTFLRDTFDEASLIEVSAHTPNIGGAWVDADISGGGAFPGFKVGAGTGYAHPSGGTVGVRNAASIVGTEWDVEIEFERVNTGNAPYPGVYVGTGASGAGGYFFYFPNYDNEIRIYKSLASYSSVGSVASFVAHSMPATPTTYRFQRRNSGADAVIKIFVNEEEVHSYTDTSPPAGGGFVTLRVTGAGASEGRYLSVTSTYPGGGDTQAPTLDTPTGVQTSSTTANVGANTNENNGTMYAVASLSATVPTALQVESGQNHTGSSVPNASLAISSTGPKVFPVTGLSASTSYYAHVMHKDAAGNRSNVVTSTQFTTAAGDPAPTFIGPSIPSDASKKGQALTSLASLNVSGRFADNGALTFSAIGSWPPGVTVSSAGVISGIPTTVGTYTGLAVRATDSQSQTIDSNTFSITVSQAVLNMGTTGMQLGAATGSDIATFAVENAKSYAVAVYADALPFGSAVASASGSMTNASGFLSNIASNNLNYGTAYYVVGRRESDGESFITRVVAT